jgi:hypothetical protein
MSTSHTALFNALVRRALPLAGVFALIAVPAPAQQGRGGGAAAPRTIEERTATMRKLDGYFPLYWDSAADSCLRRYRA